MRARRLDKNTSRFRPDDESAKEPRKPVTCLAQPLAPIAVFAYKRPEHLQRALEALHRDPLFGRSPVHIYCDGARSEAETERVRQTRDIARRFATQHTRLVFREQNLGLRKSIVSGVSELTEDQGRVIVVEDDLVVGDQFLSFMNAALDRYADNDQIEQVSGHQFPVSVPAGGTPLFLPFTTTWGWATWKRAWRHFGASAEGYDELCNDRALRRRFDLDGSYPYFRMLQKQQAGEIDSWGILWYLTMFRRQRLAVFPRQSLVRNEGFDGTGTHCPRSRGDAIPLMRWDELRCDRLPAETHVDRDAAEVICRYLARSSSVRARVLRRMSGCLARMRL